MVKKYSDIVIIAAKEGENIIDVKNVITSIIEPSYFYDKKLTDVARFISKYVHGFEFLPSGMIIDEYDHWDYIHTVFKIVNTINKEISCAYIGTEIKDKPSIRAKLYRREPGTIDRVPFTGSRLYEPKNVYAHTIYDPDLKRNIAFYLKQQWFDNIVQFDLFARTQKELNDLSVLFENVMSYYLPVFQSKSIRESYMAWCGQEEIVSTLRGQKSISYRYYLRTLKNFAYLDETFIVNILPLVTISQFVDKENVDDVLYPMEKEITFYEFDLYDLFASITVMLSLLNPQISIAPIGSEIRRDGKKSVYLTYNVYRREPGTIDVIPFSNRFISRARRVAYWDLETEEGESFKAEIAQQWLDNFVDFHFTAKTTTDLITAVRYFEDFMLFFTPLWKEVGLPRVFLAWAGNHSFDEESGWVKLTLRYYIRTKKVIVKPVETIKKIISDIIVSKNLNNQ